MAVAILVSEKIFNFSELLEQKVFQSLQRNQRYSWLFSLMEIFNSGDVPKFQEFTKHFEKEIASMVIFFPNNSQTWRTEEAYLKTKLRLWLLQS